MNKFVLASVCVVFCALFVLSGCEVQGPATNTSHNVELEKSVATFANSIDPYEKYTRNEIYAMLEEFMYSHPSVYASGFAVTGAMGNLKDFNYIYKDGTTFITIDGFDYGSVDESVLESFKEQVAIGEQFWSQQYVREDGSGNKINVSTLFTPIVNDSGNVIYVLTVDQIEENE